jgi:hypothetical protein
LFLPSDPLEDERQECPANVLANIGLCKAGDDPWIVERHGLAEQHFLDEALDRAPQRPGTHGRVVAPLHHHVLGRVGQLDRDLVHLHLLAEALHQLVDDALDLVLGQLVEDDHLVDAVQQLGAEHLLQLAHDAGLHVVVGHAHLVLANAEAERGVLRDRCGPDVRGHDHDRVLEVHVPALGVGQASLLQHLQEDVEHVGMRLLDLVQQHHRVRLAADGLGQLAALVVADVAGRRADQPGHGMLLHVLRHVDLDHRVLVAEQELGQRARQLGHVLFGNRVERGEHVEVRQIALRQHARQCRDITRHLHPGGERPGLFRGHLAAVAQDCEAAVLCRDRYRVGMVARHHERAIRHAVERHPILALEAASLRGRVDDVLQHLVDGAALAAPV